MRTLAITVLIAALAAGCGSASGYGSEPSPSSSSSPAQDAPPEVVLTCADAGETLSTPAVAAQPDGVHVRVVNSTHQPLAFAWSGGGENAPVGTSRLVLTAAPGAIQIGCTDLNGNDRQQYGLDVSDPAGVYEQTSWTCDGRASGSLDYAAGARGVAESDLPDAARKAFAGEIQDGDVIRPAGYPEGDSRSFQLVRGGDTVGELEYMPDGRWLLSTHDSCT